MSFTLRVSLCLLALSLSLINPALAQTQSVPNPPAPSEVNDLAAALVAAASEKEQERLLARKPELMNSSLLAALKTLADPFVEKGDYAQAIRISQIVVRIADRVEGRVGLGNAMYDLGMIYNRQDSYAQAMDYFQKSFVIYEETSAKKEMARALLRIGEIHRLQSRFDQALVYFNRGLTISQGSGDKSGAAAILRTIGIVHKFRGHYELALEFYQKSRAICEELKDMALLGKVVTSIGNVYLAQGSYELALEYYQKGRALSEVLNDNWGLAVDLSNIGIVYNFQGRYTEALVYFQKSIKINEELGGAADKKHMASNLHSLGMLYRKQGRYDQSLDYYRKCLKIREELDDRFGISFILNNIGVVYKSQGLYEQALGWFQKGLMLAEEMDVKESVATCLNNIGDINRLQGRHDLALEHLRRSLRLREEIGDNSGISLTLNNLGQLYQDQGRYAEMLDVSRRSAKLAEAVNAREALWNAQDSIGRAVRELGQPTEARRSFLDAIATIESLRHDVAGGGQQQQSFLENKLSPWLGMIDLLVSKKEYAEALTFAEQSKARVLLDALQAGRASLSQSLSPRERQAEEEHRHRLVSLNSQLTSELRRDKPDPARVADLKASIEKARLEYEGLETSLYVAHPELKVHRGEASIIKAEELAALLPDTSSALLEYVVTDDQTYLFAITKTVGQAIAQVQVFTIPIKRAELAKQTESFRVQLAGRDLGFRPSARKLYDLLLKPAQALLRGKFSLVIVPDDKLWELPFQALLTRDGRYVIERSNVSYVPSLTVLREMKAKRNRRQAEPAGTSLLALGNPTIGKETIERAALTLRDEKLDPLPEAEQEVKALSRLYGRSLSKVYIGAQAREDRLKAEAGQARILHFATHGILNNASPMYSHLVLAQGDKNEDGLLEAWELMRLDLKADLAVLSACETARGRFGAGEGMIGLSWALFVAGVPSTVVSQWKVESASTRDLMLAFHRQLQTPQASAKQKATKAEALRQAALTLMKNPETSHPLYWGGFVLVGNDR